MKKINYTFSVKLYSEEYLTIINDLACDKITLNYYDITDSTLVYHMNLGFDNKDDLILYKLKIKEHIN